MRFIWLTTERNATVSMIEPLVDRPNRMTLGADKAFYTHDFDLAAK